MEFGGKVLPQAVVETNIPFLPKTSGKIRDIYDLGERLLIVATDRISAYDSVLASAIPCKGRVLTSLSLFWFDFLKDVTPNHLVTAAAAGDERLAEKAAVLTGRSMLVRKARGMHRARIPFRLRVAKLPRYGGNLRDKVARWPQGIRQASRSDFHTDHEGRCWA